MNACKQFISKYVLGILFNKCRFWIVWVVFIYKSIWYFNQHKTDMVNGYIVNAYIVSKPFWEMSLNIMYKNRYYNYFDYRFECVETDNCMM